jgi:hypothetical protein
MKRILIVLAICGLCGITDAQVGSWEVQIKNIGGLKETGIGYITLNGDATFSGYSLTTLSLGIATYSGTWSTGDRTWSAADKGSILIVFSQSLNGQTADGMLFGKLSSNSQIKSLKVKATFDSGRSYSFKAKRVSSMPDISGNWTGTVKQAGQTVVESFTATSNPNFAGVFDFSGQIGGSLTGTGQVIVASNGAVSGYSITETGGGLAATISGKVNPSNGSLTTKGIDENGIELTGKFFKH